MRLTVDSQARQRVRQHRERATSETQGTLQRPRITSLRMLKGRDDPLNVWSHSPSPPQAFLDLGDRGDMHLFYLARIMGTSVAQIDATYGPLMPDSEAYLRVCSTPSTSAKRLPQRRLRTDCGLPRNPEERKACSDARCG
jgi:hypothetical protein